MHPWGISSAGISIVADTDADAPSAAAAAALVPPLQQLLPIPSVYPYR